MFVYGGVQVLVLDHILNLLVVSPETRSNREMLESKLFCGIPNMDLVDDVEVVERTSRRKRVVGGLPANPVSLNPFSDEDLLRF